MKGSANQTILEKVLSEDLEGQLSSRKANVTPLRRIQSRFQNRPAEIYKTEDAKIFENQVIG